MMFLLILAAVLLWTLAPLPLAVAVGRAFRAGEPGPRARGRSEFDLAA